MNEVACSLPMELLAPVGWADVATKQDLLALETRMDARLMALEARTGKVEDELDEVSARSGRRRGS